MTNHHKKLLTELYIPISIGIILLFSIISLTSVDHFKDYGYVSLQYFYWFNLIFFVVYLMLNRSSVDLKVFISFSGFLIIQILNMYFNGDYFSSERAIRITLFIITILLFTLIQWNKKTLLIFSGLVSILIIYLFFNWFQADFSTYRFKSLFRNPNNFAILLFVLSYFIVLAAFYFKQFFKYIHLVILLMILLLIYASQSRAIYLSITVVVISLLIFKFLPKLVNMLFYIVMGGNISLFLIALNSNSISFFGFINDLSENLLTKSFFNGRDRIWSEIYYEAVLNSPWFGYGYGVSASHVSNINPSTHNVYLQILLESGFVGLISFLIAVFFLWKLLLKNKHSIAGNLSIAYFLAIIVYINFELILFPNTLATIAIFMWLIITFGINFVENNKKKSEIT